MRIIILLYYIFFFPVLIGYLFERIFDNKNWADLRYWWEGFVLELFLFCMIRKIVVLFQGDFHAICSVYTGISVVLTAITLLILSIDLHRGKNREWFSIKKADKLTLLIGAVFTALLLFQIVKSKDILEIYVGDNMGVYVSTIVSDGSLFVNHPLTGLAYISQEEIVNYSGLTVFYAFLASAVRMSTLTLLYKLIPVWMLCMFYNIQYSMGKSLFWGGDSKKTLLYCISIVLITMWGSGKHWVLPSFLLGSSWTEDAMQICFILPLIIWMLVRLVFGEKRKASIAILISLCMILVMNDGAALWLFGGLGIITIILWGLRRIDR